MLQTFLILSISALIAGGFFAFFNRHKESKTLTPLNVVLCAVFIANMLIFIPIYFAMFKGDLSIAMIVKTIILSLHHAIRLFVVDSDFEIIRESIARSEDFLYYIYTGYTAVLFLLSPIMTFGFIFSFFKNVSAYRKFLVNYNRDIYIFSEFNEESMELGLSIKEKFADSAIVFTNVSSDNPFYYDYNEKAKNIKAITFEKEITALNFRRHSKNKNIHYLFLSKDESLNVKNALEIIEKYNDRANTQVYVLSNDIEGELLLNSVNYGEVKVRRISNTRTMIYSILQNSGAKLFENAVKTTENGEKLISAVVVGLGNYGREMTKALSWFCQMEGYRIEIDAFEINPKAKEYFESICPELMDVKHNNKFDDPGDAQYRISIHSGVDVDSAEFSSEIKKLKNATYVFVALGEDKINIRTAIKLRALFEQMEIKPQIQAVVGGTKKKNDLSGITNYSGQPYDIEFVGAINDIYSYGSIINSDIEQEALNRHLCWGDESEFWKYEYAYRSSVASALHKRMKIFCNVPGADKAVADRTEEEKRVLRMNEHRRWNAYMRTEGYTYAEKRNNLAKTHHCLVTFDALSQKEQEKDDD